MLFSEIYGNYYNAVAAVLRRAAEGNLTGKALRKTVQEEAFGESNLTIPSALENGSWPFLTPDYRPVLRHAPTMPLTLLQKRWLKSLLLDPRIRLFSPSEEGLEEVEPLYDPNTVVYFDRHANGDPYSDETYIRHFQTALSAIKDRREIRIHFIGGKGTECTRICIPLRLEYSPKNDKFRLQVQSGREFLTINLGRILELSAAEAEEEIRRLDPVFMYYELEMELTDERNALERAMLHFSDLEKETVRLDRKHYRIRLRYRREDETEILIRILSFGPMVKVLGPERFVCLIRNRLRKQAQYRQNPERKSEEEHSGLL